MSFVHQKSHMDWPVIGPGPARWQAAFAMTGRQYRYRNSYVQQTNRHYICSSSSRQFRIHIIITVQSMGCERFLKSSALGDHGSTSSVLDFIHIHIQWLELMKTYFYKICLLLKTNVSSLRRNTLTQVGLYSAVVQVMVRNTT